MRNPDPLIEPEPVNISGAAMNPEPWKNPDPFKNPEPLKGDDDIKRFLYESKQAIIVNWDFLIS
jgi:hypothetical protein